MNLIKPSLLQIDTQSQLNAGLRSWWSTNSVDTSKFVDSSNKLHGEWTAGSPDYSYCEKTKRHAVDFSNTEIQTASVERFYTFTMCCWVKINYAASDIFARILEHGRNNSVTLCINKPYLPNKFSFQQLGTGNGGATSNTNISGDWQHVSIKYDGSTQYIYVDGDLEDTYTRGSFVASSQVWHFGRNPGQASETRLVGSIADVRYFNRSISDGQIKSIYLNPSAPFQKKTTTVVSVPVAPPTTTAKAVVLKKPKPSYATGYAKNASESANPNLWKGLVGAWMPSFGVTGNTLKDVSGNGNDGTLTNMDAASDWVATSKGLALDFDGSNDYVSTIGYGITHDDFPDTHFTASAWFKWGGGGGGSDGRNYILQNRATFGNVWPISLEINSRDYNPPRFATWENPGPHLNTSKTVEVDRLYHFVVSRGLNNAMKIYVDGKEELSATITQTSFPSFRGFHLGTYRHADNRWFDGSISNVTIYNRALSPTEIKQLYLNPAAPFERKSTVVGAPPPPPPVTNYKAVKVTKSHIKPSFKTGYARNASESANPNLWKGLEMAFVPDTTVLMKDRSGHGRSVVSKTGDPQLTTLSGKQATNPTYPTSLNSLSVKAVEFDGNDGLNIDSKGFTRSAGQPFSCFTVFRRTSSAGNVVISCRSGSGAGDLWKIGNNSFLETYFSYDPTGSGATVRVSNLAWNNVYAICGVYNGQTLQMFVNGVKRVESALLPNAAIDQSDYRIGYSNTYPEYFYGKIGPTYIYSKALTASEIKNLTANPLAPFEMKYGFAAYKDPLPPVRGLFRLP